MLPQVHVYLSLIVPECETSTGMQTVYNSSISDLYYCECDEASTKKQHASKLSKYRVTALLYPFLSRYSCPVKTPRNDTMMQNRKQEVASLFFKSESIACNLEDTATGFIIGTIIALQSAVLLCMLILSRHVIEAVHQL